VLLFYNTHAIRVLPFCQLWCTNQSRQVCFLLTTTERSNLERYLGLMPKLAAIVARRRPPRSPRGSREIELLARVVAHRATERERREEEREDTGSARALVLNHVVRLPGSAASLLFYFSTCLFGFTVWDSDP